MSVSRAQSEKDYRVRTILAHAESRIDDMFDEMNKNGRSAKVQRLARELRGSAKVQRLARELRGSAKVQRLARELRDRAIELLTEVDG